MQVGDNVITCEGDRGRIIAEHIMKSNESEPSCFFVKLEGAVTKLTDFIGVYNILPGYENSTATFVQKDHLTIDKNQIILNRVG